jgi:hypothetical protein
MKHTPPPTSSEVYYYTQWKHYSLRFILALSGMMHAVIWGIVAALYDMPHLAIWLGVAFALCSFIAAIAHRECDRYHTLHLRSLTGQSLIDSEHTCE